MPVQPPCGTSAVSARFHYNASALPGFFEIRAPSVRFGARPLTTPLPTSRRSRATPRWTSNRTPRTSLVLVNGQIRARSAVICDRRVGM